MQRVLVFLLLLIINVSGAHQPKVSSGTLMDYANFQSKFIGARMVRVWLPDGFDRSKKYQVLYANDGQMLWDEKSTWNGQEWKLDETIGRLLKERKIKPTIVVAIDNAGAKRHSEYFPQRPFENLTKPVQDSLYCLQRAEGQPLFNGKIYSDAYLKFLVQELKPFIDAHYPTLTDARHTYIMGSSMGGLISMYAAVEYPQIFGGAICMSTHWPGTFSAANNPIPRQFAQYLNEHLTHKSRTKFYFDFGTETLDALYEPFQKDIDAVMKAKKYSSRRWRTMKFAGADHSEKAWSARLGIPLEFMLK